MKFLCFTTLLLGFALSLEAADEKRAMPSFGNQRFLFIVDTSSSMDRLRTTTETTVHNLIAGGISRQMTPGDTYGLWTFNKEISTDFPMQVWDSRNASQLGTVVAAYLSERTYEKSSNPKQLMNALSTVMQSVSNLNVLLISDGSWPMAGTPFDAEINQHYKNRRKERIEAKAPFITTLSVRDGWIINGSVKIAGERVFFAEWPVPPTSPLTATKSNASPAALASTASVVSPASNSPALPKEQAVATRPRKVMQIITKTNQPTPEPVVTSNDDSTAPGLQLMPALASPSVPPESTNSSVPAKDPALLAARSRTDVLPSGIRFVEGPQRVEAELPKQNQDAPLDTGLASFLPKPMTVAAREPSSESSPESVPLGIAATTVSTPRYYAGSGMLLFGGILMGAAVVLTIVAFRRPRPERQGSFITQSMERR